MGCAPIACAPGPACGVAPAPPAPTLTWGLIGGPERWGDERGRDRVCGACTNGARHWTGQGAAQGCQQAQLSSGPQVSAATWPSSLHTLPAFCGCACLPAGLTWRAKADVAGMGGAEETGAAGRGFFAKASSGVPRPSLADSWSESAVWGREHAHQGRTGESTRDARHERFVILDTGDLIRKSTMGK